MFEIIRKYNYWDGQEIKAGFLRDEYLNRIGRYLDNSLVKVLLGQRRVGKSYLMRMMIHSLITRNQVRPENILYINKDIYELGFINDDRSLAEVINEHQSRLGIKGKRYIFLDEVQEIRNWEKVINSLSQDYSGDFEVFISGSNSKLLSGELSTYLTGRYVTFEIFPFSFSEFCGFLGIGKNRENFIRYIRSGGMPELLTFTDDELKSNYIKNLLDSIILRDIVQRYNIRDVGLLERLTMFLIDSTGSVFSVNSVVNFLKSSGTRTNHETVSSYVKYIVESYLIHQVDRYSVKGKDILAGEKKYYLNDPGFKYFINSSFDFAIGRYLENAVYIELLRRGYKVYSGKLDDKEIDFIAEKDNEKKYIQVCYLLSDDAVINREFGNLALVKDNYEKLVLSLDEVDFGNKEGIRHVRAHDFFN